MSDLIYALRAAVAEAVSDAAELAAEEAERLDSVPGSATARSRPGEPPRRQRGDVALGHRVRVEVDGPRVTATVFNVAPHFRFLEAGTRTMRPRPTYGPVAVAVAPIAGELVARALSNVR